MYNNSEILPCDFRGNIYLSIRVVLILASADVYFFPIAGVQQMNKNTTRETYANAQSW
jgi:hypothetical protein